MIPAGRIPLGADDIAQRKGKKTLSRAEAEQLPAPISREGARTRIWDKEQVEAHLAGLQEIPQLPDQESPEDLLDREEARHQLQNVIKPGAWAAYVAHGHAPKPDTIVCGVAHWKRRTIRDWDANRPGAGAGGGRPKGSKDSKPRTAATDKRLARAQARKDRMAQMLAASKGKVTAAEIAADLGVTERQAYRILDKVRAAAK
ncbi:hypothetical protein [Actinacidiphila soli]|uniref:hypothetical protein n=1 Tax=Actinacidiphila soli TaxID=2487275 RepID=UPI000FC9F47A|nr:hypothetical protein [Actinacidiphila soli]